MQLLVNHQLIPIAIQSRSISLELICYKRCQSIIAKNTALLSFSMSKNKDLKKSATNVV